LLDTSPPESHTLSLHDALPIFTVVCVRSERREPGRQRQVFVNNRFQSPCFSSDRSAARKHTAVNATKAADSTTIRRVSPDPSVADRKSTRLNSSHLGISYAVFC